jgi:2-polyprenyl-3-methyl-5-hydroxy-6-metoxy-1,4-benzoquinol methylase
MKAFDKLLQNWRINIVSEYIHTQSKILDIGSFDGILFKKLKNKGVHGIGIEPLLKEKLIEENFILVPGYFPNIQGLESEFDCITMLAVLEHIPKDQQQTIFNACFSLLKKNGNLIITVPSQKVDKILHILEFLKIIDGMSTEEHYGFNPLETEKLGTDAEFEMIVHKQFQMGLNNLFVFKKP